ncbi:CheR family methyltransferase [Clostridium fungisolvens]|uniref:Chemotaxis protein methyltransferase n=1 Tax=Clostridium fungisolvens TaxID=1604897 RepID=A0A6V8SAA6_9CLOT|nr:protein-glutamate O-methyltransferase CheR [Clostridium fungisolvens]GFP74179.1 Chemotaxis protein methyltransferase [Clostridium fungisolvens]
MLKDLDIYKQENEDIEISLLLEGVYLKYGYDFRNYSRAHVKRRILKRMLEENIESISYMQYKILYDKSFFYRMLGDLSINVTEMFRDPSFYNEFREKVVPILKTYPFVKIWHAGCSTGEEVYSMAILLKEEGLYEQTQIYATDFNNEVLKKAKEGIYSIDDIKKYTYNYQKSGGKNSFSDYYIAKYNSVIMDQALKKKITFADHNLVTDGIFAEVNVVICRNVLIYFNGQLQDKVLDLFSDSLCNGGFLCLGSRESIKHSNNIDRFKEFDYSERIYRKKYGE